MIVTVEETKNRLRQIWPDLEHIWQFARDYYLPELDQLKEIVARQPVKSMQFIKNLAECEYFALQLHAAVRKDTVENLVSSSTIAFGRAAGLNIETSRDPVHQLNIALTIDGVYLIEPQTYQFIKMQSGVREGNTNFIFYVAM